MRRGQSRRRLCLALEAFQRDLLLVLVRGAERVGANQLDRGRARQETMLGTPHLAHAPFAQPLREPVAPHTPRSLNFPAETIYDSGRDPGHAGDQQIREHEGEEELDRTESHRVHAQGRVEREDDRHRTDGKQSCEQGTSREVRHDGSEHQDPCRDPGEPEGSGVRQRLHAAVKRRCHDALVLRKRDSEASENLECRAHLQPGAHGRPIGAHEEVDRQTADDGEHRRSDRLQRGEVAAAADNGRFHEADQVTDEVREDRRQEEDRRVDEGDDAKPTKRRLGEIRRQSQRGEGIEIGLAGSQSPGHELL